jgi:hypothetical protein
MFNGEWCSCAIISKHYFFCDIVKWYGIRTRSLWCGHCKQNLLFRIASGELDTPFRFACQITKKPCQNTLQTDISDFSFWPIYVAFPDRLFKMPIGHAMFQRSFSIFTCQLDQFCYRLTAVAVFFPFSQSAEGSWGKSCKLTFRLSPRLWGSMQLSQFCNTDAPMETLRPWNVYKLWIIECMYNLSDLLVLSFFFRSVCVLNQGRVILFLPSKPGLL